ncbi:MAG: acetylornithine transaminase [Clostridiales bacterium]
MNIPEKSKNVIMNTYARYPIALVKGQGSYVFDEDGNKYLDFISGISVNNLGHCHPDIVAAVQNQAASMLHCSNLFWSEPQLNLAEKLVAKSGLGKVFFANSGAEANEGAIKLARKYFFDQGKESKNTIITMDKSFHGRTLATLTATGQDKVKVGFSPLMPGFKYVPFNDFAALKKAITPDVAGIMLEPVQGEGGVHPGDGEYLKKVRTLCDEKEILLIFDEIQCGLGRCGALFCYENYGVLPDIVTLAKALGGGIPMGAFIATDKVAASFGNGTHGSTFGGNPIAAAAGNQYLTILEKENIIDNVKVMSKYLQEKLKKIPSTKIVDVRGMGLLIGIEVSCGSGSIVQCCFNNGLLVLAAGADVVRLLPPLNCTKTQIDEAVKILEKAIMEDE